MSERPAGRIVRAYERLRVAVELALVVALALMMPFALALIPPSERETQGPLLLLALGVVLLTVAADLVATLRRHRAAVRGDGAARRPGRDALWDRVERDRRRWVGVHLPALTRGGATAGPTLQEALVRALRAEPLEAPGRGAGRAAAASAEFAAAALGLTAPPRLFVADESGANAAVAGDLQSCAIVFGGAMLASFNETELLGVVTGLLSRVRQGATVSVKGAIGGPVQYRLPADRPHPALILNAYRASDAEAVLALRDPQPVIDALQRTANGDPYMPGLTIDEAQLMWTWPSSAAPFLPQTDAEVLQGFADLLVDRDGPLGTRVELVRLRWLEDAGARSERSAECDDDALDR